jgi:hypothetical protein
MTGHLLESLRIGRRLAGVLAAGLVLVTFLFLMETTTWIAPSHLWHFPTSESTSDK